MADLERRLQALAGDAFPPAPDVRAAVAARLPAAAQPGARAAAGHGAEPGAGADPRAGVEPGAGAGRPPGRAAERRARAAASGRPAAGRWRGLRPRARRRVLALAAGLLLVPAAAVAAVPETRHAVLEWLGIEHVRVERVPRLPAGLAALDRADLGTRVATAAEAGRRAGFAVSVPRALGAPDAVFVSAGGVVSLAYEPRPGLPRDRQTGLGLLVTELRARGLPDYLAKKVAGPHTRVEAVRVGAARGMFVSGEPHELLVEQARDGMIRALPARLAGNALAFERGGVVTRLEGRLDRDAALALARSLAPPDP